MPLRTYNNFNFLVTLIASPTVREVEHVQWSTTKNRLTPFAAIDFLFGPLKACETKKLPHSYAKFNSLVMIHVILTPLQPCLTKGYGLHDLVIDINKTLIGSDV